MRKNRFQKHITFIFFFSLIFLVITPSIALVNTPLEISYNDDFRIVSVKRSADISLKDFDSLNIDILNVNSSSIILYATDQQINTLSEIGIQSTILYQNFYEMMGFDKNPEKMRGFHDYYSMTAELQDIANTYPNITNLYELGQSIQGRIIWGLKITDNPDIEENEAEIRFDGCHHGNEYMSVEMPLNLAWLLVQNYSIDPTVTDYIDNREIWIVPMVNPDGRQMSQRRNANNVDINRDYGYMWDGQGSSPSPFSQPETQAIREHGLQNNIVISYSYHTTAEYVNYVWDYKPQAAPDEPWIDWISQVYADYSGYVKTQGFDWYQTMGASDDGNYGCFGNINTIIETLNSDISAEWDRNRDAMLFAIDVVDMGLTGFVTDAVTGDPISASIWVEEHNWPVFSDPLVGDYYKPLFEGTYTVHFRANGYEEHVEQITIIDANASNFLNTSLLPGDNYYGHKVTSCEYFNYLNNPSEGISALGPPDNISASLGNNGMMVVDMGNNTPIINEPGDDVKVFEGDLNFEGYDVYASDQWNGPWSFLGSGFGTSSFDLEVAGLEDARYIKIEDDGISSTSKDYPGFDLDAIQALNISRPNQSPFANFTYWPSNPTNHDRIYFTDTSNDTDGSISSWSWDFDDGNTSTLQHPSHIFNNIGNFLVSLTITDNDGEEDQTSRIIHVNNYGPNAKFINSPLNPLSNEPVQFTDLSYDTTGDTISSWTWVFGDGNTSNHQHPTHTYQHNGSFNVTLTVGNTSGGYHSITKSLFVGFISIDIPLSIGWNLITIPITTNWYASDLSANITGCLSVSRWDAVNQTYRTYIVGGPPVFDFPIVDGCGYFVDVDISSMFQMISTPIFNASVPLKLGWNLIGWYLHHNTTASSLADNITGCLSVSRWDAVNQTYRTYIVGGPPVFDFPVNRGMGMFVDVDQESIWHGEG